MDAEKVDYFGAADKAIKAMNRSAVTAFGKLKAADWEQLNIIRTVQAVYRQEEKKAKRRFYEIAAEAYIIGLMICGIGLTEAHRQGKEAITPEWAEELTKEPDMVTGYRFDRETERKAERLTETLAAAGEAPTGTGLGKNAVIDKAMRDWSRMFAQTALGVTIAAVLQAYADAGVEEVEWLTVADEKVCGKCGPLHGRRFRLADVPPPPHWGCRCRIIPVGRF